MTESPNESIPSRNDDNRSASSRNNNKMPASRKNDGNGEVDRFSGNNMKHAKKLRTLKGEKLAKS